MQEVKHAMAENDPLPAALAEEEFFFELRKSADFIVRTPGHSVTFCFHDDFMAYVCN